MTHTPGQEFGNLQQYDDLCARLYTDPDLEPGTRELALAMAWAQLRDPTRHTTNDSLMRRVGFLLGRDRMGRWRHSQLFADDAPRYEPPRAVHSGSCVGPRVRPYRARGAPPPPAPTGPLVCGDRAQISVRERSPVTGQIVKVHWYCRRHAKHADTVREHLARAGEPPPPLPNKGGRLPRYFTPKGLAKIYASVRPGWEPPIYGLCADDWPSDGLPVLVPKRPRLSLVVMEASDD
ncbi:hypothetical protein [Actinophytocola sp.]|uniref:hypothetical protein n=1 Tax=Actinophytocola sp. TaxID=1872138 RepID=UPI002ED3DFA2